MESSSARLRMRHGRACGRVSVSKALGLRCGSRSQLRAMIPCLLLRVRVNIYLYVDGWMGIYCPARRFFWRGICRRWSSFSLLFASLSLSLSLPSLSHYRDCCVCVNCFSFLWFSEAEHNTTKHSTTQPWHQHPTSKKALKHTVHLHPISVRQRVTMERSSDVAAPLSSMEKFL